MSDSISLCNNRLIGSYYKGSSLETLIYANELRRIISNVVLLTDFINTRILLVQLPQLHSSNTLLCLAVTMKLTESIVKRISVVRLNN